MSVSLRDVAERAGVSVATASRVLSGSDYPVRATLREKVQEAAAALDYVPNAQAQGLLAGRSNTVGVLVGEVGDPYFATMVNGIHDVATEQNLLVTICGTARDMDRELAYFRLLQAHRTGIVILAGSGMIDETYATAMAARTRSFVASGGRVVAIGDPAAKVDRVLVDNRAGMRLLGDHLVSLGHRRVGMVAGNPGLASTQERIAGVREAIENAGGEVHVRHVPQTREGGLDGAAALCAEHPNLTAVVGSADQMALGAMQFIRDQGRRIPEDVAVAGCNDISAAQDAYPQLTSVRLPLREMGATALRLALADASAEPVTRLFEPTLVVRGSTART